MRLSGRDRARSSEARVDRQHSRRQQLCDLKKLPLLADAVYKKCETVDGLKEGLIDDPRGCDFDPARDLPKCTSAHVETGETKRARPLCHYPEVTQYKGGGSIDAAENFPCAAP